VDYAKEQAPPEIWHTAGFKKVNLVLTSVRTVVFLVSGGLGLIAANVHTKGPAGLAELVHPDRADRHRDQAELLVPGPRARAGPHQGPGLSARDSRHIAAVSPAPA
jgi:hypothetical protein